MLVGIFQYFFEVPRYFLKIKSGHTVAQCDQIQYFNTFSVYFIDFAEHQYIFRYIAGSQYFWVYFG